MGIMRISWIFHLLNAVAKTLMEFSKVKSLKFYEMMKTRAQGMKATK
jgi:hypothetical protein